MPELSVNHKFEPENHWIYCWKEPNTSQLPCFADSKLCLCSAYMYYELSHFWGSRVQCWLEQWFQQGSCNSEESLTSLVLLDAGYNLKKFDSAAGPPDFWGTRWPYAGLLGCRGFSIACGLAPGVSTWLPLPVTHLWEDERPKTLSRSFLNWF